MPCRERALVEIEDKWMHKASNNTHDVATSTQQCSCHCTVWFPITSILWISYELRYGKTDHLLPVLVADEAHAGLIDSECEAPQPRAIVALFRKPIAVFESFVLAVHCKTMYRIVVLRFFLGSGTYSRFTAWGYAAVHCLSVAYQNCRYKIRICT